MEIIIPTVLIVKIKKFRHIKIVNIANLCQNNEMCIVLHYKPYKKRNEQITTKMRNTIVWFKNKTGVNTKWRWMVFNTTRDIKNFKKKN